jgi:serine/threonine protein phosphatase PrpC
MRGTSHEKTGQPCQGAHCWNLLSGDVLVVAVADGAGSAALGEIGAAIAAQTAIDTLRCREAMPAWPTSDAGWRLLLTATLELLVRRRDDRPT